MSEQAQEERRASGAGPDFAAQAEHARRTGDAHGALEIARQGLASRPRHTAGRVAAGLALLDLGRVAEARSELEAVVHVPALEAAALSDLADDELESALNAAAPERESMVDAEGIALQAVAAVEQGDSETGPELPGEAFRTHSMARLLERQGDQVGAEAIRRSLQDETEAPVVVARGVRESPPEAPQSGHREEPAADSPKRKVPSRRVKILERWLHNVRRGQA